MKWLFLSKLLLIGLLAVSCRQTEPGRIETLLSSINEPHVLIAVIDFNDCLMCYGGIEPRLNSLYEKYDLPVQSRVVFFPGARKSEVEPFLLKNLKKLTLRDFGTILYSDPELESKLRVVSKDTWKGLSGFILLDREGNCVESAGFK